MLSDDDTTTVVSNIEMSESKLKPFLTDILQSESISEVRNLCNTVTENLPSTSKLLNQPPIIINVKTLEQSNVSLSSPSIKGHNSNTIINVPALEGIEQCLSPEPRTSVESYLGIPTPDIVNIPLTMRIKVMVKNNKFFKKLSKKPLVIWGFVTFLTYVLGLWFDTTR